MIQRDIDYGGDSGSGGYTGGFLSGFKNEEPKEPKKPKKSNKWIEIWFLVAIMIIASIIFFDKDPEFSGYCLGGAIMLPLIVWYFDN